MKFLIWMLGASLAAGAVEPPMPAWRDEDREALEKGELVPGLTLLTEEIPDESAEEPEVPSPTAEEIANAIRAMALECCATWS